jgi:hypothetical protein
MGKLQKKHFQNSKLNLGKIKNIIKKALRKLNLYSLVTILVKNIIVTNEGKNLKTEEDGIKTAPSKSL